jgi:hypothetical protein
MQIEELYVRWQIVGIVAQSTYRSFGFDGETRAATEEQDKYCEVSHEPLARGINLAGVLSVPCTTVP